MSCFSDDDDPLDVPSLWRALEELEEGTLDPSQGEDLTALLNRSPAARRAYLEYFQQSAVLRMEAAKLHEQGLLPVVGRALQTRRSFQVSVLEEANLSGRFVRFGKPSLDLKKGLSAYTGWVDEIALWNRPLSPAEVARQF